MLHSSESSYKKYCVKTLHINYFFLFGSLSVSVYHTGDSLITVSFSRKLQQIGNFMISSNRATKSHVQIARTSQKCGTKWYWPKMKAVKNCWWKSPVDWIAWSKIDTGVKTLLKLVHGTFCTVFVQLIGGIEEAAWGNKHFYAHDILFNMQPCKAWKHPVERT